MSNQPIPSLVPSSTDGAAQSAASDSSKPSYGAPSSTLEAGNAAEALKADATLEPPTPSTQRTFGFLLTANDSNTEHSSLPDLDTSSTAPPSEPAAASASPSAFGSSAPSSSLFTTTSSARPMFSFGTNSATPTASGGFGSTASTGSPGGLFATSSAFGSSASTSSSSVGLFGASSATPAFAGGFGTNSAATPSFGGFGSSAPAYAAPTFGSGSVVQLGSTTTPSTSTGAFVSPAPPSAYAAPSSYTTPPANFTANIFGAGTPLGRILADASNNSATNTPPLTAPNSGGAFTKKAAAGLSGASTPSSSGGLFGNATSSSSTSGGLFGNTSSSGGLFGNSSSSTSGTSGGLFGNATPSSGALFRVPTSSSSTSGGLFGNTSSSGGQFGNTPAASSTSGGLFGMATTSTTASPFASGGASPFFFAPQPGTPGNLPNWATGAATSASAAASQGEPKSVLWNWSLQNGSPLDLQADETAQDSAQPQDAEARAKSILALSAAHSSHMIPMPSTYLQPTYLPTKVKITDELTLTNFIDRTEPADERYSHLACHQIGQIAFNSLGDLFVSFPALKSISHFVADGSRVRQIAHSGIPGGHSSPIRDPSGLAIDFSNRLFYCNSLGDLVVFDLSTNIDRKLNAAFQGFGGTHDGPLQSATFCTPKQLHFAKNGDLLVVDSSFRALRIIKSDPLQVTPIDTGKPRTPFTESPTTLERRNIASRTGVGLITPQSHVYTLCRVDQPNATTPSPRIMPNGGLFCLTPVSSFHITRDGLARHSGLSGEGMLDVLFETESGFAAILGRAGEFGLAPLDPYTGMVNGLVHKLFRCPDPMTPQNFGTNSGFSFGIEETSQGILPLPDRTGYLVANSAWKSNNLTIVTAERYGPRFSTPPHCARPFNLSPLLRSDRNAPSLKPSSTFMACNKRVSFPIHDIVLQKRCPSLLDTEVQERLSQLALPQEAFEDLFCFLYEDCLPPLNDERASAALRFMDLHLLACICQLETLADFAQSRCLGLINAMPTLPTLSVNLILKRYPLQLLQEHKLVRLALIQLSGSSISLDPELETAYAAVAGEAFTPSKSLFANLLPPLNANDPFGRFGECFVDLCPTLAGRDPEGVVSNGDFELVVKDHSFRVHSLIIAARWPFFAQMLDSGLGEAANRRWTIDWDWTPAGLCGLIRYFYTGYLGQLSDKATCFDIVSKAEFLGLDANSFEHEGLFRHCSKIARLMSLQDQHLYKETPDKDDDGVFSELKWLCQVLQEGDPSQVESAQSLLAPRIPDLLSSEANLKIFEQLPISVRVGVLVRHHTLVQASAAPPTSSSTS